MEIKSNDATPQRPEGDRVLDAAVVTMDLNHFVKQIKSEPSWKDSDRNSITIYKANTLRIVLIGMHQGAELTTHTADGKISVQVLTGHATFTAGQQSIELKEGQMVAVHELVPHSVKANKETFLLLTLAVTTHKIDQV
ncbi:MAG TPA: cupin domain-containing protein [Chitinophagales bacterium]|nr:cupin domain-containing protein [Chitinophagales bacterium]